MIGLRLIALCLDAGVKPAVANRDSEGIGCGFDSRNRAHSFQDLGIKR